MSISLTNSVTRIFTLYFPVGKNTFIRLVDHDKFFCISAMQNVQFSLNLHEVDFASANNYKYMYF